MRKTVRQSGFTLIEVLLALAIIGIALTALLKATAQNISNTQRVKEKAISHWIAMQGVSMIQLGLIQPLESQESTEVTTLFGQRWYWRIKISKTPVETMQQLTITVSKNQAGPFLNPVIAYRIKR